MLTRGTPRACVLLAIIVSANGLEAQGTASDREAVEQVIETWNSAANRNDLDGVLALVADNLEMIPPGELPARGEEARAVLRGFLEPFELSLNGHTLELLISGDLAVRRYEYELSLTPKAGGATETHAGQGIHVLQRMPDGSWKFVKDIWNEGPL